MSRSKVTDYKDPELMELAVNRLKALFPKGSIVASTIKHVSRSGMSRVIAAYAHDGMRIRNVSIDVARVLGWSYDGSHGGVVVEGCGMDMAFHLTYTLSRALYADDYDNQDARANAGYLLKSEVI